MFCCFFAWGCSSDSVGQPPHTDGDTVEFADGDMTIEEDMSEEDRGDTEISDFEADTTETDDVDTEPEEEFEEETIDYPAHGIEPAATVEIEQLACTADEKTAVLPGGALEIGTEIRADPGPTELRRGTAGLSGADCNEYVTSDDQGNIIVVSESDAFASYSGDMGKSWSGDYPLLDRRISIITAVFATHNRYALLIEDDNGEGLLWKKYPFTEETGWEFVRLPDDLPEGTSVNFSGFRLFDSGRLFYFYKMEGDNEVTYYARFSDDGGSSFSQPVELLVDTHHRRLISITALGNNGFLWILGDESDVWLLYEFDNSGQLQPDGQSILRPQYSFYTVESLQGIPVLFFYDMDPCEGVFTRYDITTHTFAPFVDMPQGCHPGLFRQSAILENGELAMFTALPDPAQPHTYKLRYVVQETGGLWRSEDILNYNVGISDECYTSKSEINAFAYPDGKAVAMVSNYPALRDDAPYERNLTVPMNVYSRDPNTGQWPSVDTRVHSDDYWPIPIYPRWVRGMDQSPLLVWGDLLSGNLLSWVGTTWSRAEAAQPVQTFFDSMQWEASCFLEPSTCPTCGSGLVPWDISMGSGTPGVLILQFDIGGWYYAGGMNDMQNQSLWRTPLMSYTPGMEPQWSDMQEVWKDPLMLSADGVGRGLHFEMERQRVHSGGTTTYIYTDICGGDMSDCYHPESPRGRYAGLLVGTEDDTRWSALRGRVQGTQGEYLYKSYPMFENSDVAVFPDGRIDIVYWQGRMVKFLASTDQGSIWQKLKESNVITLVEPSVPGWGNNWEIVWLRAVDRPGMAPAVLAAAKRTTSNEYRMALLTWRCEEQRWAATTDTEMSAAHSRWETEGQFPAVAVNSEGVVAVAYASEPALGGKSIVIRRFASDGSTSVMDSAPVEDFPQDITLTFDGDDVLLMAYTRLIDNIPAFYSMRYKDLRRHLYMRRAEVRREQ